MSNLPEYYKQSAACYWDAEYKQNGYKVVHDAGTEQKTLDLAVAEIDFFLFPTAEKSEQLLTDKENNPWPTFNSDFCLNHHNIQSVLLKPLANCVALDYGCGILGRYTFALSKYFKEVCGIDISTEAVVGARAKQKNFGTKNVRFVLNNGLEIPSPAGTYDFIFSNLVLQHIGYADGTKAILREFARTLKSDGIARIELLSTSEKRVGNFFSVVEGAALSLEEIDACGLQIMSYSDSFPYLWITAKKK